MSRKEQSWATTKDDSIIVNTLFENIVLFFMTVFVLLCGSENSNNSSTSHEIQIHHFFLPQQHKALYNILKNYSSKQDSHQPHGIMNHNHHHGRKNPSIAAN